MRKKGILSQQAILVAIASYTDISANFDYDLNLESAVATLAGRNGSDSESEQLAIFRRPLALLMPYRPWFNVRSGKN